MGLKRRRAPNLGPTQIDTLWFGDEAVDQKSSDLDNWCRTADPAHLVMKDGEKPVKIVFRPLTEREESALPITNEGDPRGITARCYEAARYGLMRVAGENLLRRRNEHGLMGLTDAVMDELTDIRADIPLGYAFDSWNDALGIEGNRKDRPLNVDSSLVIWVGIHVIAATFRAKGVDA